MEEVMNRKGFIGGSDCVQIMQGNWLQLWQIKTGLIESEDLSDNLAVQLGVHTEDFNLQWFEKSFDCVLSCHQSEFKDEIGIVSVKGTVDAMWNNLSYSAIIEAKHTNAFNSMNDMVKKYMPQMQLYMHMSGVSECYLSVIFGNSKWEAVCISYDKEYFNSMWAVVSDFWGYVLRNEEPIGVDTPSLSIDKIPLDEMVARDATYDNRFIDAAVTYINKESDHKQFETAKKNLKDMIAENEREVYCDQLSVKRDKRGSLRITKRNVK
tara:strand:- start:2033 stop:2830 length:798 start_codon:yes stop_codon:yes gene_type:complete